MQLRTEEKRFLVGTVVQLATTAMFKYHINGFAGHKFQQMEGGPIGLHGTYTIARLIMQMYNRKWEDLVKGEGINLELYLRYMDDGRLFLHALRRGWRWVEGWHEILLKMGEGESGQDTVGHLC